MYCNVCNKYRKSKKKLRNRILKKNTLTFSIVYSKCGHEYEKIFKEEESIKVLKNIGSINNME